ncbi:S-adenosylmethionine decarboxylase [Bacillus phage vB_BcoS-136]|uniref:S-adenosylmethionine decarboxylase proenzyme n=1 Tax=Bacillus phage vB_BcoS-136 TaxID=2419619 RepID=A0A3G3BVD9_9CAUD|nr:S-adenosylmethionine decarboxylase [Bacillus phage vB_BcoS-136]AYP68208.1 S-adenosylmethionine decarboxylase proenzyme precursor [Bacillus phage vB_BcoS-136]
MSKFKIGDRVVVEKILNDFQGVEIGNTGTVENVHSDNRRYPVRVFVNEKNHSVNFSEDELMLLSEHKELEEEAKEKEEQYSTEGKHMLVDAWGVEFKKLNDLFLLRDVMSLGIEKSGAKVISIQQHKFNPNGVTIIFLLSESHFSIHTYPEQGYAGIDCYTCGDTVKPEVAVQHLLDYLEPKQVNKKVVSRGNNRGMSMYGVTSETGSATIDAEITGGVTINSSDYTSALRMDSKGNIKVHTNGSQPEVASKEEVMSMADVLKDMFNLVMKDLGDDLASTNGTSLLISNCRSLLHIELNNGSISYPDALLLKSRLIDMKNSVEVKIKENIKNYNTQSKFIDMYKVVDSMMKSIGDIT